MGILRSPGRVLHRRKSVHSYAFVPSKSTPTPGDISACPTLPLLHGSSFAHRRPSLAAVRGPAPSTPQRGAMPGPTPSSVPALLPSARQMICSANHISLDIKRCQGAHQAFAPPPPLPPAPPRRHGLSAAGPPRPSAPSCLLRCPPL